MKKLFQATLLALMLVPLQGRAGAGGYTCSFVAYHSMDEIEISKAEDFVLNFTFDTITNDAFLVGNNGVSPVFLVEGEKGITFLEVLSTGAVQTTTIAFDGGAVHSRHSIISGALMPTQYYGFCE
ncbi:hypothetical protein [Boseongicola aestuarii]|uniref:Uncharacterized protein n=1 Tax=Boseongicola aestuarii TaxID=1470561 RepID=A0A238J4K0_9RHOB|nr:hypothetical protein [Boseongicola aestuarii]SMX25241.1 hypothetical protein BOA8489_03377 [Boseongicola aestuarii]